MLEHYFVKFRNETVADIYYDTELEKFSGVTRSVDDIHKLPLEFTVRLEIKKDVICHSDIVNWLEERVIPRDRRGIETWLKSAGMVDYDVWEIAKLTRARNSDDENWVCLCEDERCVSIRDHKNMQEAIEYNKKMGYFKE